MRLWTCLDERWMVHWCWRFGDWTALNVELIGKGCTVVLLSSLYAYAYETGRDENALDS